MISRSSKLICAYIALVFIMNGLVILPAVEEAEGATTIVVAKDESGSYTGIQAAINAASAGDTVFVKAGTYPERVEITKSLTLKGEGPETIINASYLGNAITIKSDNVRIENLRVTGSGTGSSTRYGIFISCPGIYQASYGYATIIDCTIDNNVYGICFSTPQFEHLKSNYNTIQNCTFLNNQFGIMCCYGDYYLIEKNYFEANDIGICLGQDYGKTLGNSQILNNTFGNNTEGIRLREASNDNIDNNTFDNCSIGISMIMGSTNTITGNRFKTGGISMYYQSVNDFFFHGQYNFNYGVNIIEGNTVNGKPYYYFEEESNVVVPSDAGGVIARGCTGIEMAELEFNPGGGVMLFDCSYVNISKCNFFESVGINVHISDNININNCSFLEGTAGITTRETTARVENCDFNNSLYYAVVQQSGSVNATGCWWGDASGPSGEGSGTGDNLGWGVIYDPWLTKPVGRYPPEAPIFTNTDGYAGNVYTLAWNPVSNADGYLLYVDGTLLVNTTLTTYQVYEPGDGTYTYSVKAWNDNGVGSASDDLVLHSQAVWPMKPGTPTVITPENEMTFETGISSILLGWSEAQYADSYEIAVSSSPDFEVATTLTSTSTSITISSAGTTNGKWYWKVRAKNDFVYGDWSSMGNYFVESLNAPTFSNTVFSSDTNSFTVQWSTVDAAVGYLLMEEGTEIANTTNTDYTVTKETRGEYTYTVKAWNVTHTSSASASMTITFSFPITITVAKDGSGDHETIQDAIDAATSGDTIYVKNGRYAEIIYIDGELTLIGENNTNTIIESTNGYGPVYIGSNNFVLDNFYITGSTTTGMHAGAISINYNDSVVRNCTIAGNVHGITLVNSVSNTIEHCTITNNQYGIIARPEDVQTYTNDQIHYNNIYGNSVYGIYATRDLDLNATNNWWGDASGPSGQGSGSGDAVGTGIIYDPWTGEQDVPEEDDGIITVAKDGSGNHMFIQDAINASEEGDTILVKDGTYLENLTISKGITIRGQGMNTTRIDGNGAHFAIVITGSGVVLENFTITGCNHDLQDALILIDGTSENNTFRYLNISDGHHGIYMGDGTSDNNLIEYCYFNNNPFSSILHRGTEGTIQHNFISNGHGSISIRGQKNTIRNNTITNDDWHAMEFFTGNDNQIVYNTISHSDAAIVFLEETSENNTFYHNNFIENGENVDYWQDILIESFWNNTEGQGNYWSDYSGTDNNGDGIGDTNLPHQEVDNFPFMEENGWLKTYEPVIKYPPTATITSPAEDATFVAGTEITFAATGSSDTDGTITEYTWNTTNENGNLFKVLGHGQILTIDDLAVGDHVIQLTVYDNDWFEDKATVNITILAPEPVLPEAPILITDTVFTTTGIINLTWSNITNADGYNVYMNDVLTHNGTDNKLTMSIATTGTYTFNTKAWNASGISDPSNTVSVVAYITLVTPEIIPGVTQLKYNTLPITINGTILNGDAILYIEYKIDDGEWELATGVQAWKFNIGNLEEGTHKAYVRAKDATGNEYTADISFEYSTGTDDEGDGSRLNTPGFEVTMLLAALAISGTIQMRKRR